jgi:putative addiction module component (TIGR02574 family)
MARSYEEIHQLAKELPADQRIMLANALWESVDAPEEGTEAEIAAAWGEEVERRLKEIDSGKVEMIPLEDVLADMDARIASKRRG